MAYKQLVLIVTSALWITACASPLVYRSDDIRSMPSTEECEKLSSPTPLGVVGPKTKRNKCGDDLLEKIQVSKTGIPYNLPKSVISVTIESKTTPEGPRLTINAQSENVPNEEEVYLLKPENNSWLVKNEHTVILENNMLSSISTKDTGETGAVIKNTVDTIIDLAKAGIAAAQSDTDAPFLSFQTLPTDQELKHILEMAANGTNTLYFEPEQIPLGQHTISSTNGALVFSVNDDSRLTQTKDIFSPLSQQDIIKEAFSLFSHEFAAIEDICDFELPDPEISVCEACNYEPKVLARQGNAPAPIPSGDPKPVKQGLFVETLGDFSLGIDVYLDLNRLRQMRLTHLGNALHQSYGTLIGDQAIAVEHECEQDNACNLDQLTDVEVELRDLEDKKKSLEDNIESNRKRLNKINRFVLLSENEPQATQVRALIDPLEAETARYVTELSTLENTLIQMKTQRRELVDQLQKKLIQQNGQKVQNCHAIAQHYRAIQQNLAWKPEEPMMLLTQVQDTLQVVAGRPFEIPVTRAAMGETLNAYNFDKGILKKAEQTKPSEAKVLTEALVAGAGALKDGVIEILRIPAEVLGIQTSEVQAKQTLTREQIALQTLEDRNTGTRQAIQQTLLQHKLEQVQADPEAYQELIDDSALTDPQPQEGDTEGEP